jgi:hypothetical protein
MDQEMLAQIPERRPKRHKPILFRFADKVDKNRVLGKSTVFMGITIQAKRGRNGSLECIFH